MSDILNLVMGDPTDLVDMMLHSLFYLGCLMFGLAVGRSLKWGWFLALGRLVQKVVHRKQQPQVDTVNVPWTRPDWIDLLAPSDYAFFVKHDATEVTKYIGIVEEEAYAEHLVRFPPPPSERGVVPAAEWAYEQERREKLEQGITITPFAEWKDERKASAGVRPPPGGGGVGVDRLTFGAKQRAEVKACTEYLVSRGVIDGSEDLPLGWLRQLVNEQVQIELAAAKAEHQARENGWPPRDLLKPTKSVMLRMDKGRMVAFDPATGKNYPPVRNVAEAAAVLATPDSDMFL